MGVGVECQFGVEEELKNFKILNGNVISHSTQQLSHSCDYLHMIVMFIIIWMPIWVEEEFKKH
jgi:hypothetical protein